jgi:hypothetical protein
MPQILHAASDVSISNWKNESGATTNLFASIDESVASDTDYIESGPDPANEVIRFALTQGVTDPTTSTGYGVNYRYGKTGTGQIDITVRVVEGASTVIASWTHTDVPETPVNQNQTLSTAQADSITNHNNLFFEYIANYVPSGGSSEASLSTGIQHSFWWLNHGD